MRCKVFVILCFIFFVVIGFASDGEVVQEVDAPFVSDVIRAITGTGDGEKLPHFVLFLGRFHPLVLHLPIGIIAAILLLEIFMQFYRGSREHIIAFKNASVFLCLAGGVTGIVATSLGWMVGSSLSYDIDTMTLHGYICTAFSAIFFLLAYLRYKEVKNNLSMRNFRIILVVNLIVLSVGGHYGGNLTHGNEYLFKHAPDMMRQVTGRPPKPVELKANEDSEVYSDIIVSIMNARCLSCHSEAKVKGDLRMDSYEAMIKGGEIDGAVFIAGNPEDSAMYWRVIIDPENDADDELMPPAGKPQLTTEQKELIYWWIKIGAPKLGKVKDFKTTAKILNAVKKQDIVPQPILNKKKDVKETKR